MGGYNSGPHSPKPATSEAKRVDIRYMRRHGLLRPYHGGALQWTCNGEPSGHIRYTVYQESIELAYKVSVNGGDWQDVWYTVQLEDVPCRYGGVRHYFRCPARNCNRRCEVLYYSNNLYFLCRKCCGYLYPSQKGDKLDQLRWAQGQIGERIFEDWNGSEGWRKRKGMHWRTFENRLARYQELDAAWGLEYLERVKAIVKNDPSASGLLEI